MLLIKTGREITNDMTSVALHKMAEHPEQEEEIIAEMEKRGIKVSHEMVGSANTKVVEWYEREIKKLGASNIRKEDLDERMKMLLESAGKYLLTGEDVGDRFETTSVQMREYEDTQNNGGKG